MTVAGDTRSLTCTPRTHNLIRMSTAYGVAPADGTRIPV